MAAAPVHQDVTLPAKQPFDLDTQIGEPRLEDSRVEMTVVNFFDVVALSHSLLESRAPRVPYLKAIANFAILIVAIPLATHVHSRYDASHSILRRHPTVFRPKQPARFAAMARLAERLVQQDDGLVALHLEGVRVLEDVVEQAWNVLGVAVLDDARRLVQCVLPTAAQVPKPPFVPQSPFHSAVRNSGKLPLRQDFVDNRRNVARGRRLASAILLENVLTDCRVQTEVVAVGRRNVSPHHGTEQTPIVSFRLRNEPTNAGATDTGESGSKVTQVGATTTHAARPQDMEALMRAQGFVNINDDHLHLPSGMPGLLDDQRDFVVHT